MNPSAIKPLVSVIIPAYNAEKFIKETLESLFAQTWENKEIIVVNDGSTDNTLSMLAQINHPQLKVITQRNTGASKAKQTGLESANGDYIQYLDADDILSADKIEDQLIYLLKNPGKVAICKTAHFFDGDNYLNKNIPDDDCFFNEYLNEPVKFLIKLYGGFDLHGGMIQPNSFLIPKSIAVKSGSWNASISPCPDEDGEYFCRIILNSKGIIYNPAVTNYYRRFKGSKSLSGIKSEIAYKNLVSSTMLKHLYLLNHCTDQDMVPYIHTATYRLLDELKSKVYPTYMNLYNEINETMNSLNPHIRQRKFVYGGKMSNFIGNKISWKLLRRLQVLKIQFNLPFSSTRKDNACLK